jgi:ribonuclease HI
MKKPLKLYTDGSYFSANDNGGYAAISDEGHVVVGGELATTNNRMEILAVTRGLDSIEEPRHVEVRSDSQYVVNAFEKKWIDNWEKKGWKTSNNTPVKNQEEWKELQRAIRRHTKVKFKWVRGHNGDPGNEAADNLAKHGAELPLKNKKD